MTVDQSIIFALLAVAIGMFVWGKWRYDVVAMGVLMVAALTEVVPSEKVFLGFGHPAVITVAAILAISRALQLSGMIDYVADFLNRFKVSNTAQVFVITITVGALSAFMNNVGALALMLPVALQYAGRTERPASELLMPLSFGSLLGGLVTMIGTPPNLVIAEQRKTYAGESFAMFDFFAVGSVVALTGIAYIAFIGWRLLPQRRGEADEDLSKSVIADYISEVRLPKGSMLSGKTVRAIETFVDEHVCVLALMRGKHTMMSPAGFEHVYERDVLLIQGHPGALRSLIEETDLQVLTGTRQMEAEDLKEKDIELMEVVISPGARIENLTARSLRLHARFGINLLAIARQGRSLMQRLGKMKLKAGDVLLLQGDRETLRETINTLGCLPLAGKEALSRKSQRSPWPILTFTVAIALTATGVLAPHVSFMTAVTVMVATKQISLRDMYDSIEWPVIVLLGAMIPVGEALSDTGGAGLIADSIIMLGGELPLWCIMLVIMVVTMLLSDVINNTATAVLMGPIAAQIAQSFEVSVDPFLMCVAVAASSTYLTPIGHQSNILVMGPGGYKFGDYWRMGIFLDVIILCVSLPAILYFWPV